MKVDRLIPGLLVLAALLVPAPCRAYRLTAAGELPLDPEFVERLALDATLRSDILTLLSLTSHEGRATPASLVMRGDALSRAGLLTEALGAYRTVLEDGVKDASSSGSALEKYLQIAQISGAGGELAVPRNLDPSLDDRQALLLGTHLMAAGQTSRGLELLARSASGSRIENRVLASAVLAQDRARQGNLPGAISSLGSLRSPDTSAYTNLYYLVRGNLNLAANSYSRARDAYLAVPPESPFSAEAIHGLSWSLIMSGDLTGAAVRLTELISRHPYADLAREAALDLALCYRDLGLYDLASEVLSGQVRRLSDYGAWMRSIQPDDLADGSDLLGIVLGVISDRPLDAEVTGRLPAFVLAWARHASADAELRRITSILDGIRVVEEARGGLEAKLHESLRDLDREIFWTTLDLKSVEAITTDLQKFRRRLPSLADDFTSSLDTTSLERFSTNTAGRILTQISSLESRLTAMENSVSKSQGFSAVLQGLESSVSSPEEEQLLQIRRSAYEGLMISRQTLQDLRSDLRRLSGKVWLGLKMEAIRFQNDRTTTVDRTIQKGEILIDRALSAEGLIQKRLGLLRQAAADLRVVAERESRAVKSLLIDLQSRTAAARTARLLTINAHVLSELELAEARTMYTAADVEITRMQELLKAMQGAVP